MRCFAWSLWLPCALVPAVLVCIPFSPQVAARPVDKPVPAARSVSFLREVRPILAQHCFQCHGPDEAARKGKLRLDLKDDALGRRKGKYVIAPGKPGDSLVWDRLTTTDEDRRMP